MGRTLRLNNPVTLNEKIQWLKLNDRKEIYTTLADKYKVRGYISETIGEDYLIPLKGAFDSIEAFSNFEWDGEPVIIKCNHDSAGGIIIRKKSDFEYTTIVDLLKRRLNINHYYSTKEAQYKNIDRKIIIEKLLLTKSNRIPNDYKFHCFNGVVKLIYVSIDREGANYRKIYDESWNSLEVTWAPKGQHKKKFYGCDIEAPSSLKEMIELSERLSRGFCYVRIDLYDVDGKVYFGEITQHHGGGFETIEPYSFDEYLGGLIDLQS